MHWKQSSKEETDTKEETICQIICNRMMQFKEKDITMTYTGPLSWWNWNLEMLVFVMEENLEENLWSNVRTNNNKLKGDAYYC